MRTNRIFLIGAGGHAKVVLDALLLNDAPLSQISIRDDRESLSHSSLLGCPINFPAFSIEIADAFFHLSIGHAEVRRRMWDQFVRAGARALTIRHPLSAVSEFATVGDGSFLAAGAIVAPSSTIGCSVIVNHGAVVDHDCFVDSFSHIAPNATLGGGVKIGAGVLVGAGATILPGIEVAERAVIGAGTVVTKNVGVGEVLVGVPGTKRT